MLKILKYLRKYWKLLVVAICLIVIQAYCDLELPKYMSNMIDIGIRQYGVDDTLPDVFSERTFGEISLFMTDEDYNEFKEYYIGVSYAHNAAFQTVDDKEYAAYKKKYAKLNEGEEVYLLKRDVDFFKDDYSKEQIDALREKLKTPTIIYAAFNDMLTVSAVSFLSNNYLLSSIWALFDKIDLKNNEELQDYIRGQEDWDITKYFERLKEMSVEKDENGRIKYGNSEKKLFMGIVSGFVGGDFMSEADGLDRREIVDSLVNELGFDEEQATDIVGRLEQAVMSIPMISDATTSYIFELGNVDYKKYEYERAGVDTYILQINYIVKNGIFMLLYTLGSIAAVAATIALSAKVAANVARDLRRDVFSKVQSFSNTEFDKFSTSSLITRTTNDINQLQNMLLLMLRNTFYSLFIVIGGLYYLYVTLKIDISLMLLIALIIGIIAVGVAVVYIVVMPKFSAGQKFLDKINLVTRERLSGVLVIRANNNEPREEEKYEGVNRNITKVGLFIDRTIALLNPLMLLLLNILGIIIVYTVVDRNFLVDGSILPGTLLAFLQYAIQIIFAVMIVAGLFVFLPRAVVAMRRIAEILSEKPIVADPENPLDIDLDGVNLGDINSQGGYSEGDMNSEKQALDRLTDMNSQNGVNSEKQALDRLTDMNPQKGYSEEEKKRDLLVVMLSAAKNMRAKNTNSVESDKDGKNKFDIKFENVSFKYSGADAYALKDVSFEAKSGKTTAIVGVTGSGKTTLVNLILRFYDPTEGAIFVNGVDIRRVRQADLRKHIGFVSQQPTLFSGTVGENLSAGNENASAADMDHAIAVAKADDFVNGRDFKGAYSYDGGNEPDKYDAVISREGKNISGGQKQRLSIARAVVRKPRLYVLDDSFSALDYLTEANLRAELTREAKENNVGVIVISQRIASVLNADDIIALDGGRIIGRGTHSELMKTCPQYGALARSQLPEDEL